jgi:tRNA nucleotidyltransferase/poly(A) polymerase
MQRIVERVAGKFMDASSHRKSVALMRFLSDVAKRAGVAQHVYVVGGAVRNFLLNQPIKDIDVVIDSVALGGRKDSEWFANMVSKAIPAATNLVTNQYGVAILTVSGSWDLEGEEMRGEVIEIANARKESYDGGGGKGKGYKPTDVQPATITEDVYRREFTVNTLLWRLLDLANGPDKAEIVDITGLGKAHLQEKLLVTPLDPSRTFSDDPTRILRLLKFWIKYGLKPSPDVEKAAIRNADNLKTMPWEAVATILTRDILDTPKGRQALLEMDRLGIIPIISDMFQTVKPFAAYMSRHMGQSRDVQLLLDLADIGVTTPSVGFLSKSQQARVREITLSMSRDEANAFLSALKQPPVKTMEIVEQFDIPPRERGGIALIARDMILVNPALAERPQVLQQRVMEHYSRNR